MYFVASTMIEGENKGLFRLFFFGNIWPLFIIDSGKILRFYYEVYFVSYERIQG